MCNKTGVSLNIHLREGATFNVEEFDTFVSLSLGDQGQNLFFMNYKDAVALAEAAIKVVSILKSREVGDLGDYIKKAKEWVGTTSMPTDYFVSCWDKEDWLTVLEGTGLPVPDKAQMEVILEAVKV